MNNPIHITETMTKRFWAKIDKSGACWPWIGNVNIQGYGVLHVSGTQHGTVLAHRYSYTLHKGPIPNGLHLDHVCRNRRCVNPDHLEAVTHYENIVRGLIARTGYIIQPQCGHGHERTPENTRIYRLPNGRVQRECRACQRERGKQTVYASATHCRYGHEFTTDNLYVNPRGERVCRTCLRGHQRRYRDRLRQARPLAPMPWDQEVA